MIPLGLPLTYVLSGQGLPGVARNPVNASDNAGTPTITTQRWAKLCGDYDQGSDRPDFYSASCHEPWQQAAMRVKHKSQNSDS